MARKYSYATSQHRPDGLSTIWVYADPKFSSNEIPAKLGEVIGENLPDCKVMITAVNDNTTMFAMVDKETVVSTKPERSLEILVAPQCKRQVIDFMKEKWPGEWTEQEGNWQKQKKE